MLELNNIYQMDCLEGIKKLPDNSIDLCIIDPPYFIINATRNFKKTMRRSSKNTFFNAEWDNFKNLESYKNFIFKVLLEIDRVLKPKAQVYMFFSYHHIEWIIMFLKENFRFYKQLIWHKPDVIALFQNNYAPSYEAILWFRTKKKGYGKYKFKIKGKVNDVFIHNSTNITYRSECGFHPTPKPIQLIRDLIKYSSDEGDTVLDCFMGSGTTAVACKQMNRNFIGFEINPEYVSIAKKRLQQEVLIWNEKLN